MSYDSVDTDLYYDFKGHFQIFVKKYELSGILLYEEKRGRAPQQMSV